MFNLQDGSCNGLQHYAALGRDYLGGKKASYDVKTHYSSGHSVTYKVNADPRLDCVLMHEMYVEWTNLCCHWSMVIQIAYQWTVIEFLQAKDKVI